MKSISQTEYAIQNVATGNAIRPFDAQTMNGNKIIAYGVHDWECITWEMIELEKNTYILKNLYTQKTFEPNSKLESGVSLWQQSLGGTSRQYWEFIKQENETYLIKLKGTDFYLTNSSKEENAPILLMPLDNSNNQKWKLIRQTPWI